MSVKGNEATTTEQAENLLNDLVKCDNPYNCPHGRPTIISFTRYELERMFKRVMNYGGDIMIHEMRLNNEPFNKIKEGTKTVELRLLS